MDELIELIVRALIELFSNRSSAAKKPPPAKVVPPIPPIQPQRPNPQIRRQQPSTPMIRQQAMTRQQALLQELMLRGAIPVTKQKRRPGRPSPPPPKMARPVPPVAVPPRAPTVPPPPPQQQPRISADAIGRLVLSRPSALRTAYVLSEVLQPPLALRNASHLL